MNWFMLIVILYIQSTLADRFESTLGHIKTKTSEQTQKLAVEDLLKRIIPDRSSEFKILIDKNITDSGLDAFNIQSLENGTIQITGTIGVAAAWGFHHYLKYFCKAHIGWQIKQLKLPTPLPEVNVTITSNDRFRYYQNVCAYSYSYAWWSWNDWEKHIDWMALNGFNLGLAFNGQEAIWQRVYKKFNLSDHEIDEHFAGPAFLPWARMGNIRGWGGPLSQHWHDRSLFIQKSMLRRMRDFGIVPVLPAFSGYVPRAFKRLYPQAKMRRIRWANFKERYCCPYLLEPTEELFKKIGSMYLIEQTAEFGTNHIYNCDTFNELNPNFTDVTHIRNIGKSTFEAMTDVDPKAIWLMQGWLFYSSQKFWNKDLVGQLLTSVPLGRMLILDLQSEQFPQYTRLDSYFGQPFIWCMLHNFGATKGMFGASHIINKNVFTGRSFPNSTMVGTGLTPEGINTNYVIYDLMTEMAWRKEPVNLTEWFMEYSIRRYGDKNEYALAAWKILQETIYVYNFTTRMKGKCLITMTPRTNYKVWFWYDPEHFMQAWDQLILAADDFENSDGYLYDIVDVTRQALQNIADMYYNDLKHYFHKRQIKKFQYIVQIYRQLFSDMDLILSSNEHFLLGSWLEAAKSAAGSPQERRLFEFNARNQLTLWGPKGEVMDYAGKQWGGMVGEYFAKRWDLLFTEMNNSLLTDRQFIPNVAINRVFREIELPFTHDRSLFPTKPKGDTIQIAKDIYRRWRSMVKSPDVIQEFHTRDRIIAKRTLEQIINIKIEPDLKSLETSEWLLTGPFIAVSMTNFIIVLMMFRFLYKRFMNC